jgi:ribonuclease HI
MNYTIYTDGSCKPTNPGYAGCGIVVADDEGNVIHKASAYLGEGTNNIAELTAIKLALEWVLENGDSWDSHILCTDSNYAVGLLTKNWNASKNQELVADLRKLVEDFPNTQIKWVKGHNKDIFNELADELANAAVDQGMANE